MHTETDISAYLDGTLPDKRRKALEDASDTDAELTMLVINQQWIDAGVRALLRRNEERLENAIMASVYDSSGRTPRRPMADGRFGAAASGTKRRGSRTRRLIPLSAAAALTALILWKHSGGDSPPSVAVLRSEAGARWDGANLPKSAGELVRGSWRLAAGVVEMEFPNGVTATLEGPAEFELTDARGMRLDEGKLAITVPPAAREFVVTTPVGEIANLGARSGLKVSAGGLVEAHVFGGSVHISPQRDFRSPRRDMAGGMALALDSRDRSIRPIQPSGGTAFPRGSRIHDDLLAGGGWEPGTTVSVRGMPVWFGVWGGDIAEISDGWKGVAPHRGVGMLRFIDSIDINDAPGRQGRTFADSDQWQFVDLEFLREEIDAGAVTAEASMWINQSGGEPKRFQLMLSTYDRSPRVNLLRHPFMVQEIGGIVADADPATWQEVRTVLDIPPGSVALAVQPAAVVGETVNIHAGYFADSLSLRLVVPPRPGKETGP